MALVLFGAVRSSPGVTTSNLAVASCIPQSVAVEGDPDGGVLAARYELAREPNLASLATASRTGVTASILAEHTQALPGGLAVVAGMPSPDLAVALWRSGGRHLALALASVRDTTVIVDAGRLTPTTPVGPLLEAADVTVLVARPTAEDLYALAHRVGALRSSTKALALMLVGDLPYGPAEVAAQVGVDVLGVIAHDPRAAAALAGTSGSNGGGWLRRSPLARSARSVAEALLVHLYPAVPAASEEGVSVP